MQGCMFEEPTTVHATDCHQSAPADHELTVSTVLAHHARMRPDHPAVVQDDATITYGQMHAMTDAVAVGLQRAGVRKGDFVACIGKNSTDMLITAAAAIRAGAVFTPLNRRLAGAELARMLDDCKPAVLVCDAEYASLAAELAGQCERVPALVVSAGAKPPGWLALDDWRETVDQGLVPAGIGEVDPGDVAVLVYTSGTTGRPKGVMLTHRNLRALVGKEAQWPQWAMWSGDDVGLFFLPLFHVSGIGWWLRGLFPGSKQVLMTDFDSGEFLRLIARHRVTHTGVVASALQRILQDPQFARTDLSSLRYLYYGASATAPHLLAEALRAFRCGFIQSYGQTEAGGAVVSLGPDDHTLEDLPHMASAGRPFPGVEVRIIGPEGETLPPGTSGEIALRSPANMAGYLNMPEETAATLQADGWLLTGDAGYLDENGFLYVRDRIKEMIITGGENVYPAEVENAIAAHPAVAGVAVIGVPSERWGQEIKAVVELRQGHATSESELIAWARQRIAGYKLPKSIAFIEALPRNATGKVTKAELRRLHAAAPATH